MQRYVFLHKGTEPDRGALDRIASTPGLRIIDRESSRAMLAEADEQTIADLRRQFSDWIISPEVFYETAKKK